MKSFFLLLLTVMTFSSCIAQVKFLIFVDNELIFPQFVSELSVVTDKNEEFKCEYDFANLQIPEAFDTIDPRSECLVSFNWKFKMKSTRLGFTVPTKILQAEYLVVRFYSVEKYNDRYLFSESDYIFEYDSPLGSTRLIQKNKRK